MLFVVLVFFFKQKTAYERRISDWSSDVCSSDLMKVAALLSAFDATDVSDDACKHGNSLCVTNALVKLHPVWAPHPRIGKPPAVMRRAEAVQPNVAQGGLSPSNQSGRAIEQQPIEIGRAHV